MAADVWTGVGLSNLKNLWDRIGIKKFRTGEESKSENVTPAIPGPDLFHNRPEVYEVWNFLLRLRSCFGWIYSDSVPTPKQFKVVDSDSCLNSKVNYQKAVVTDTPRWQWWSLETWSRSRDVSRDPFFEVSVSKVSGLVSVSVSNDFGLGLELFVSRLCKGYFFWSFARSSLKNCFKKWLFKI